MSQIFDPLNLILLAIALIVLWRLRSVLGQRTGLERPPIDTSVTRKKAAPEAANGNVLEFPQGKPVSETIFDAEPQKPVWEGFAEAGSGLASGLEKVAQADPGFTPKSFIEGAKLAYEMVVDAFAKGDKPALKNLLSSEVFEGFSRAIEARQKAGEKLDFRFVGFDKVEILAAALTDKRATMTLKFVSQLISATYDKAGLLIDGEPKEVRDVTDVWSFERDITQRDPNWRVVSTEAQA